MFAPFQIFKYFILFNCSWHVDFLMHHSQVLDHHNACDSARRVMEFAKDMLRCSKEVRMPHNGETVSIRIGMHSGPCVTGLVGERGLIVPVDGPGAEI